MTVAIFMETETHIHLLHGEDLGLTIRGLLDGIEEDDELKIVRIFVVDHSNLFVEEWEDLVYDSVLEFKKNREADEQLKQQENV